MAPATPSRPISSASATISPASSLSDPSASRQGLNSMLASWTQQQMQVCEAKKKQYGFDFYSGNPTNQPDSPYVWERI